MRKIVSEYQTLINGQMVNVKVCPPAKFGKDSSVQKTRYQGISSVRGERWVASENGQFKGRE